jgi:hypothetical protein
MQREGQTEMRKMRGLLSVARKTAVFLVSRSLLHSLSLSLSAREEMGSTLGVCSGRLKDCVEAASIEDFLCRIGCE